MPPPEPTTLAIAFCAVPKAYPPVMCTCVLSPAIVSSNTTGSCALPFEQMLDSASDFNPSSTSVPAAFSCTDTSDPALQSPLNPLIFPRPERFVNRTPLPLRDRLLVRFAMSDCVAAAPTNSTLLLKQFFTNRSRTLDVSPIFSTCRHSPA